MNLYNLITKYEYRSNDDNDDHNDDHNDDNDEPYLTHQSFETLELLNKEMEIIKKCFSETFSRYRTHISFLVIENAKWLEFEIPEQFGSNRNKNLY